MSITIHLFYTGTNGNARSFAGEMRQSGIVDEIRAEDGNEGYEYYLPMDDPETVLLIDRWRDQASLDLHHASPCMRRIAALREKYDLHMRIERFLSEDTVPASDREFIRR